MEKALFRSTQSNTNTAFGHGNTGVVLNTNRMHYYMRYNEFTNVNAAINVPLSAGAYTTAATGTVVQNGIYLTNLIVKQNTFSPGSGPNTYLNRGVNLSCPNSVTPAIGPGSGPGISIETNEFNSVYRGIAVNGLVGMPTAIHDNTITLTQDVAYSQSQQGISINNCIGTTTNGAQTAIYTNTLSSVGSTSLSNTLANLMYVSQSGGPMSPSITCNSLKNSYRGFVFSQNNPGVTWRGNTMQDLKHGFALTSTASIGQQGASGSAIDNEWLGSWTTYTQTFVENGCYASNSKLYVRNLIAMNPTLTPFGTGNFINWYNNSSQFTTSGGYYCNMPSTDFVISIPGQDNYGTSEGYYVAITSLYRFLYNNDSISSSIAVLHDFLSAHDTSTVGKFLEVDFLLAQNDLSSAQTYLNYIDPVNQVEANYIQFYQLYIDYLESDDIYSDEYKSSLISLASLCPADNGGCIYQARALYNVLYDDIFETEECPPYTGAKQRTILGDTETEVFDVSIYPNPTNSKINFVPSLNSNIIEVHVLDITGRSILIERLNTGNLPGTMNFQLSNGLYLIKFISAKHEAVTKHFIISK
jgi:hypothetical protein